MSISAASHKFWRGTALIVNGIDLYKKKQHKRKNVQEKEKKKEEKGKRE